MPDTIVYLIDMKGSDFNRKLNPADRMSESYFTEVSPGKSNYLEGRIGDDPTFVGLDLTGMWTEIGLHYAYSALIDDQPSFAADTVRREVVAWEKVLRTLIPAIQIFRVAALLVNDWTGREGINPISDQKSIVKFIQWLQGQHSLYWCSLR